VGPIGTHKKKKTNAKHGYIGFILKELNVVLNESLKVV
jgi:hypothetical protein